MSWWLPVPEVLSLRNCTSFQEPLVCFCINLNGGMPWCIWLRYCATSRKVTGSIPDGDNGIYHWHLLPAPLLSWGRLRLKQKWVSEIFPISEYGWQCRMSRNREASVFWNPQGLSRAVKGFGGGDTCIFHIKYTALTGWSQSSSSAFRTAGQPAV
jgi:hypothetical protein